MQIAINTVSKRKRTGNRDSAGKCMCQAIAKPVLMEHVSSCRKLRGGFPELRSNFLGMTV